MFKDDIQVDDSAQLQLRDKSGSIVKGSCLLQKDTPIIEMSNWVTCVMRERGKIVPGSRREGFNIWTLTGREYLAMLMSLAAGPTTQMRNDSVAYMGVGTGYQLEDISITSLVNPVATVNTTTYLAELETPPSFPYTPTRTTVKYHIVFPEDQITFTEGSRVSISELGLFTNGSPIANPVNAPGSRDVTVGTDAPVAYRSFEPISKTDVLQFEVYWECRF